MEVLRAIVVIGVCTFFLIATTCDGLAEEGDAANGLVTFHTRTFDLRTDMTELMRNLDTIVLDDIKWLSPVLENDPVLFDTVVHIRVRNSPAEKLWRVPGPGEQFRYDSAIPEKYRLQGFETWSSSPSSTANFLLVPTGEDRDYSVTCGEDHGSQRLLLCVVVASYPPDAYIFLQARVYFPNPLPETSRRFGAIAERMREIAYCLDVTDETKELGTDATGFPILSGCETAIGM